MLEVIISLVIVGLTIATILRSFSVSIRGTHKAEITTTATMLAERLLHEFELQRPEKDSVQGDFTAEGFPQYYWEATFEDEPIDYKNITLDKNIEGFKSLEKVTLIVYYNDGVRAPYKAIELVSYLTGIEKFTYESKRANEIF